MAPAVADAPIEADFPPTPAGENSLSATPIQPPISPLPSPPPEVASKRRQRFLCGMHRVSSSPSLPNVGRTRSSSSPYGTRTNLSSGTLAPVVSHAPPLSGSATPTSGHGPSTSTPGHRLQPIERMEDLPAPRRLARASTTALTSTTATLPADVTISRPKPRINRRYFSDFWAALPHEIRLLILSHLKPKELVRLSRVSREFYSFCFDGQLWQTLDASDFYSQIPADSLANLITATGPFIKSLNIRGCLQIEHNKRAEVLVAACKSLINASLEGCRNFQRPALHNLIRSNKRLTSLNLASMTTVTNSTCKIISQHCPQLEALNVSWCNHMDARGIRMIVLNCLKLKDLRVGEIKGFGNIEVAKSIFLTNNLERLVLSGCDDLTDEAFRTMIHGVRPDIDALTDRPIVPPRKLRHLDLSRCSQLTNQGITVLSHLVPNLEGLLLNGCRELTDAALEPIVDSIPNLTHLELEDLSELTNNFLCKHLAQAPCAAKLEHLSVSYCEKVGDMGMLPIIKDCVRLKYLDMDNTRISNLVLAEAITMMQSRAARTTVRGHSPRIGLRLVVFDCNMVTWTGIHEILSWNASTRASFQGEPMYLTEIIGIKCYYGWQQTVDEHTRRVLRRDSAAASRLEWRWRDYMTATEEAAAGHGVRRRRRLATEAELMEEEEVVFGIPRRRARTLAASCAVM
ncbi:RNI-like protein [Xylaria sp. CBS 124048]|nr:RNI-like protein [Xylaria sp. CBS 124048]